MKKICVVLLLSCVMGGGLVGAAEEGYGAGHMMDYDDSMPHGYGMMDDNTMMAPGMAGGGMMMGRGYQNQGWGTCLPMMGGGMMRHGWDGNMAMRGRGYMGQGGMMMGGAAMGLSAEQRQELMDETSNIRKKMHMLHFDYMEAARNPKTTLEELGKMEQEMLDLRKVMMKKIDGLRAKK